MVEKEDTLNGFVKHQDRAEDSVLNNFDFTGIEEKDPSISKSINFNLTEN